MGKLGGALLEAQETSTVPKGCGNWWNGRLLLEDEQEVEAVTVSAFIQFTISIYLCGKSLAVCGPIMLRGYLQEYDDIRHAQCSVLCPAA